VSAAVMLLVRSHSSLVQVIVTEDFSGLRQVLISLDCVFVASLVPETCPEFFSLAK